MEFKIEKAEVWEADSVAELLYSVWEGMEHRAWFIADNAEFIRKVLETDYGFIYKAIDAETGETAGILTVLTPGLERENLGYDAGFTKEKLQKTGHVDSVAILPQYRGRHLQALLMETAERELFQKGYRYMMCTVHPDNHFSKGNMLRQGYRPVCRKEKYGGKIRDIMLKEMEIRDKRLG